MCRKEARAEAEAAEIFSMGKRKKRKTKKLIAFFFNGLLIEL